MGDTGRQRLAAILAADAVGYSRLMAQDEAGTLAALEDARAVFRAETELHHGRVIDMAGDSVLAIFETATGAVSTALAVQRQLDDLAAGVPADRRMRFRIGVHMGDVIEKADGTVYGDGVNIAARLEGLALPGGVTVSDAVQGAVRHRIAATFEDLGEQQVKNIADPVRVFRVVESSYRAASEAGPSAASMASRRRKLLLWTGSLGIVLLTAAAAYGWLAYQGQTGAAGPPLLSLAVLPLMPTGDAPDERHAEAFTRDLTNALSQSILGRPVVAHELVAGYRGKSVDLRAVGKELNVRYIVNGDVGRSGDSVMSDLALVDALSGKQVWGGRIETPLAKISAWPTLPIARATLVVRLRLYDAETRRLGKLRERDLGALEHVLLAFNANYLDTAPGIARSTASCDEALRLDPSLPAAMYCKADLLRMAARYAPTPRYAELTRQADDLSRIAVGLDESDPWGWKIRAFVLAAMRHQWDAALEANATAIRLDPSRVSNLTDRAYFLIWMGRTEEGLPLIERAIDIGIGNFEAERWRCRAYLGLGRFADALANCERAASGSEDWLIHVYRAIAYAQLGDLAQAAAARERVLQRRPEISIDWLRRYSRQSASDHPIYWEQWERNLGPGMRKAGFAEK